MLRGRGGGRGGRFGRCDHGGPPVGQVRRVTRGEGVRANNVQAYVVLKMAAVNGDEDALDTADRVAEQMRRDELEIATQVLGQIFRDYLLELQAAEGREPLRP